MCVFNPHRRGGEAAPSYAHTRAATDRRSTEYFKAFVPKEIEKNGAPIRAAGLSME